MSKGTIGSATDLVAYPAFGNSLTYSFVTTLSSFYANLQLPYGGASAPRYSDPGVLDQQGFTSAERAYVAKIFATISSFANVTFAPAQSGQAADLSFGAVNYTSPLADAWASPGNQNASHAASGDIWLTNWGRLGSGTHWFSGQGDKPFMTIPHEINHALGLTHSNLAGLTGEEGSQKYSMMSQERSPAGNGQVVHEFQLYDIASLQYLTAGTIALRREARRTACFMKPIQAMAKSKVEALRSGMEAERTSSMEAQPPT